jgi:hypothetical protein
LLSGPQPLFLVMAEVAGVSSPPPKQCQAADMLLKQLLPPPFGRIMTGGNGASIGRVCEDYRVQGTGWVCVEEWSAEGWLFSIPLKHTNSAAMSGGWTASFAAPAASAPSPRCPAAAECSFGVVGKCADGDTAMVGWFDESIDRIQLVESTCCSYISQ